MRGSSFLVAIATALACAVSATDAGAEELRVLSAVGMRQVLVELAAHSSARVDTDC